ncbi:hypothetical protein MRB53_029363 [Persea americana]|uniref:Uncharacterized protein n=1 Tax=Persea americana TaxID=3435 RepID=A0ACC2KIR0_PERAE|nr:hypothetical protein MRB53_029363 [Persea americana]
MQESSNYSNSDDVPIRVDDLECDSKGGGTSGESSSKKKEVRKRARDEEVLVTGMKESAALVQHALDNLADSIKNLEPHKRIDNPLKFNEHNKIVVDRYFHGLVVSSGQQPKDLIGLDIRNFATLGLRMCSVAS